MNTPRKGRNPLATSPLCGDLSPRELRAVSQFGTIVDFPSGQHFALVDYPPQVVIILAGTVFSTSGGRERTLGAGTSFGTVTSAAKARPPDTFETVSDSTLFVISQREFAALRSTCPRLASRLCDPSLDAPTGLGTHSNGASSS
jgi:hypothetical protein